MEYNMNLKTIIVMKNKHKFGFKPNITTKHIYFRFVRKFEVNKRETRTKYRKRRRRKERSIFQWMENC